MRIPRLKKKDITIRELVDLSQHMYRQKGFDDKNRRMKLDVEEATFSLRTNLQFNKETNEWEQKGRDVKLEFVVTSNPISYKRPHWDTFKHRYPIIFLIHEWDKQFDSPVRIRVGSIKKPKIIKFRVKDQLTSDSKAHLSNLKQRAAEYNIKSGIQLQFFFESMRVYRIYGILFGSDYTNASPMIKNPTLTPYMSKHEWFIVTQILPRLFINPTISKRFKQDQERSMRELKKLIQQKERDQEKRQKNQEKEEARIKAKELKKETLKKEEVPTDEVAPDSVEFDSTIDEMF